MKLKSVIILFVFIFLFYNFVNTSYAYYNNMPADVMVGQYDPTSAGSNPGGVSERTLRLPHQSVITDDGKFIVADQVNNRVLVFPQVPTKDWEAADVVIGQLDFNSVDANQGGSASATTLNSPRGVATDGTRLFISDASNKRVLVYNSVPTSNNAAADVVIGQPDMTTTSTGTTAEKFNFLRNIYFDKESGKLFITDGLNNRILIYNSVPTSNGQPADIVVLQSDFTSSTSGTSNSLGNRLFAAYAYDGKLFVSDENNSRVLIWNEIPTENGQPADVVIGQPDFTSNSVNQGGSPARNTLNKPSGIFVDRGRLFIADRDNSRVLIFNEVPTANNASSDFVLGQQDFTSGDQNQGGSASRSTLRNPLGLMVHENKLFVTDQFNHRILIFNDLLSTPLLSLSNTSKNDNKTYTFDGNVIIGERGKYSLLSLQAEVNGSGFSDVDRITDSREYGEGQTIYEWEDIANPWNNYKSESEWSEDDGFTYKIKARNSNAEPNYKFYFSPLKLLSYSTDNQLTFSASIPKDHRQKIIDNIENFELYVDDELYISAISPELFSDTGTLDINESLQNISVSEKVIDPGEHVALLKAIDKWGNQVNSNQLNFNLDITKYSAGLKNKFTGWFPLQISISNSNVTNLTNYQSNLIPTDGFKSYATSLNINGIAYSGSKINVRVTNANDINQVSEYSTVTNAHSRFSLPISIYPNSFVIISVSYQDQFSYIPAFLLNI